MAHKTDPITENDIRLFAEGAGDFAFELRTLRTLKHAGYQCDHGGSYVDPATKKAREFDIRATKTDGAMVMRLAVECKNIRQSSPLLVSCLPRRSEEAWHEIILLDRVRGTPHDRLGTAEDWAHRIRCTNATAGYRVGDSLGKSLAQLKRSDKGEIIGPDTEVFDKWMQAIASANDLLIDATARAREKDGDPLFIAVLPILVVPDGTLWTAEYSLDGVLTQSPQQVASVSYYVARTLGGGIDATYAVSHLEIQTASGLKAFLEDGWSTGRNCLFPSQHLGAAYRRLAENGRLEN